MICHIILLPLIIFINVVIEVVHEIVKTVCGYVTTTIKTVTEVLDKVCSWLPWPADKICNVVKKLVEVVQSFTEWVCNTIVDLVFSTINYFFQLVIHLVRVICIIVQIIISSPLWALCFMGLRMPMRIRVSIKVLTDEAGNSLVTDAAVQNSMDTMQVVFRQCGIEVAFEGVERVVAPDLLVTPDDASGFLSLWHAKYSKLAFGCCNQITVFFIDDISGGSNGYTYWGDNWCRVDAGANTDPTIMAHEVGHMCSLSHDDDVNNLMFEDSGPPTNPRDTLSGSQCCWMKLSPFVTVGN